MNNRKGFTLVELLAVIAIVAILSVAAITGYSTMTRNSKHKSYETKVAAIENSAIKYAKEINLTNATTISVNKLVVLGYYQPDESTPEGLATVNNPENGQNMICNLVGISIDDDVYVAEYYDNKIDCNIAEADLIDYKISVRANKLNGTTIGDNLAINNNITAWTATDVVLTVGSGTYTDFVSVSYDYSGKTITKLKGPAGTGNTYDPNSYNRIAIKDVEVMFNSEVTITYNMADGTTYSRTVIVRIDKEAPTARSVIANDVTTASTKKVDLFLDDGNGSGVKGFYVSASLTNFLETSFIGKTTNRPGKDPGDGKFDGYKSYFYAADATYYIKVVDKVGNYSITPGIKVSNFNTTTKTCKITVAGTDGTMWMDSEIWYNKDITITGKSTSGLGTMGVKYILGQFDSKPAEKKLNKFYNGTDNAGILIAKVNQTEESNQQKYYLAMKGLGKGETISHCSRTLGVDKTKPKVKISCKSADCDTYLKTHTMTITITDALSGFYDSAKTIKVGWSNSKTTPPTAWETITDGVKSDADKKIVFTTNVNKVATSAITGEYYMWVQGESFADKAHNNAVSTASSFTIKYDNTAPTCTNSGGSDTWYKTNRTIKGSCSDAHSGCTKHGDNGKYTYANNGNVTRLYDYEINSTTESPGVIYDKAGNHTTCTGNQTVKIDKTLPTCEATEKTNDYQAAGASYKVHCTDSGGSKLTTCDGVTTGDVDSFDNAKTGITTTVTYTVGDVAGNTNTCSIGVESATFYSKTTRYWDNCLIRSESQVCSGGYYCDRRTRIINQYATPGWCAANGGYIGTQSPSLNGSGGVCYASVCVTGVYCHGWSTVVNCTGGYTPWTGYGDWAINNACPSSPSETCVHMSEVRYKNT